MLGVYMKVILAHNGTTYYRGGSKYFYLLARQLTKQGIEVEFVLDSTDGQAKLGEVCSNVQCKVIRPSHTIYFSLALANYLKRQEFDILHASHVFPYFYLRFNKRKPVVFQPFGSGFFTLYNSNILYRRVGRYMQRYCGSRADVVAAEGSWQVKEIMRIYGIDRGKICELPIGVDIPLIKSYKVLSRQALGLPNNAFVVLSVNALLAYKGIDILIKAFKFANLPDSKLIIIGQGSEEAKINRLVKACGLAERVLCLKGVPEDKLYSYYSVSDIYVSLSSEKDMEMGILEAACFGLPIISSKDWLVDGHGCMVTSRDPVEVATILSMVYQDGNRKAERQTLGLGRVHDFSHIAKAAIEQYERLLYR
jgi:glycosyltransferase involved in cell wall biosynthesis